MIEIIGLAITFGATLVGHVGARRFVRDRLRFVDAVQLRRAPWIAGGVALLLATPIAWFMPVVGFGSALLFGAAVGTGVAYGARDVRRGTGYELTAGA
jgi:hypothetical protein